MPLFSSPRRDASPETHHARDDTVHEPRKHGLFQRSRSPVGAGTVSARSSASGSSVSSSHGRTRSGGRGLLSKLRGDGDVDPSILEARERVMDAEQAERKADRALEQARLRVREARLRVEEARGHAKRVEREAEEDARRARIKQAYAKEVAKRREREAEEDARRARIKQAHAKEVAKRGEGLGREYHMHEFLFACRW